MKHATLFFPLLLLVACQSSRNEPYSPLRDVSYQAMGSEPFWILTIGEDLIVLDTGLEDPDRRGRATWPRTLPRAVDGVRTWQSGDGTSVISIEARTGPCTTEAQEIFEDHVRVRLSGVELSGCGGRLIGREDD